VSFSFVCCLLFVVFYSEKSNIVSTMNISNIAVRERGLLILNIQYGVCVYVESLQ